MLNLEGAREINTSSIWAKIVDEIDYRIQCELNLLKSAPIEKVPYIQQKIATLESLKKLPQDVIERES